MGERQKCYDPMLEALCRHFDDQGVPTESRLVSEFVSKKMELMDCRYQKRALVPGAGLGRLVYEVARRGVVIYCLVS